MNPYREAIERFGLHYGSGGFGRQYDYLHLVLDVAAQAVELQNEPINGDPVAEILKRWDGHRSTCVYGALDKLHSGREKL